MVMHTLTAAQEEHTQMVLIALGPTALAPHLMHTVVAFQERHTNRPLISLEPAMVAPVH